MFGIPGWMELGIIGGVILILFGKRVPKSLRSLGKGIFEFKRALNGNSSKISKINDDNDDKPFSGKIG